LNKFPGSGDLSVYMYEQPSLLS